LLSFARRTDPKVQVVSINELVQEVVGLSEQRARFANIRIRTHLTPELPPIAVSPSEMQQVLLNLINNAIDAMERKGGAIDITTRLEDGFLVVDVADTGEGIPKANLQRIFDPFFTTKEMGRGTGLGLASAYGIIANHNGIITVDSEKGSGTVFTIYLPASDKLIGKDKETPEDLLTGTETVLLVDDEAMILDVGTQILEAIGYRVLTANSGKQAIKIYTEKQNEIDIVILDIIMPEMDGGKTHDILKEINPDIKVLLSSGYSIDDQAKDILDRGCNGFIQKPFNIEDLSQKIREILDKRTLKND